MKKAILLFPLIEGESKIQYPTGIFKIATYCKNEYSIIVIDERLEKDICDTINNIIEEEKDNLLCIGLSVMTGSQIQSAINISKKLSKRIPIVWGGMHPTILPVETIQNEFIDFVIVGEGENAFLQLLYFLDGKNYDKKTFLSKKHMERHSNFLPSLNHGQYVDFTLYPIREDYFVERDGFSRAFTIETSRGCPSKCAFCHNSINEFKYRTIKSEDVINLIGILYHTYNVDGIVFQEDNFFVNKNRLHKILTSLKEQYSSLGWKANVRLDDLKKILLDEELINLLVESNCHVLQIGIESGSSRILEMINKNISVDDVIGINRAMSKYPIKMRYNFIIGFPTETRSEILATIQLAEKLQTDNPHAEQPFVNLYTPYPGTPLYDVSMKEGFVVPSNLEEWSQYTWNKLNVNWLDDKMKTFLEKVSYEYYQNTKYLKQ